MALRNSVSAAACVMVGMVLIGNMLKGSGDGSDATSRSTKVADIARVPAPSAVVRVPAPSADAKSSSASAPAATAAGVDDSLPTGSIDPGSGLHTPNPAAYGDAAKQGSSLILTGAEAINYLAGNTLRREGAGQPLHFTFFASRGIAADGSERSFVARAWNRDRPDLCEPGPDGRDACRPIQILLDAKEELQGGRLGTVTIGGAEAAELIKGNVLRVPQHIPFLDSTVTVDAAAEAAPADRKAATGWAGLVDRTAAVTPEAGGPRHFVFYGTDNRVLDVEPVEAGPDGGRAVKVAVGHWRLSKAMLCETRAPGDAGQTCFRPEPLDGGAVRLVPAAKGGEVLRAMALPETRNRALAQD